MFSLNLFLKKQKQKTNKTHHFQLCFFTQLYYLCDWRHRVTHIFFPFQDEALSPELQLSPVSLCSESSSFSTVSSPHKKSPKRTSQSTRGEAGPIPTLFSFNFIQCLSALFKMIEHFQPAKGKTGLYYPDSGRMMQPKSFSILAQQINVFSHSPRLSHNSSSSQTSSANQEAATDRSKGFHPAKAVNCSSTSGSRTSISSGQDNHHPARTDHRVAHRQASTNQHPTSTPYWSVLSIASFWHIAHTCTWSLTSSSF